jgi:DNA-directed RNA polymerase specialized sigma24 family protein
MNSLKPEMRSAIEACHFADKSVTETADLLSVSLSAEKSRISRSRTALRKKLKRYFLLPAKRQTRAARRVRLIGAIAS